MNIIVFDTETVGLNKPFCYNLGYVIYETETEKILARKSFVISQVWYNLPLFNTAYYAEKRPLYVNALKGKKTKLTKWGFACREMAHDIEKFEVGAGFAYNSPFDIRVFDFNCDWYKNVNPIETLPVYDIRGYFHEIFCGEGSPFFDWCEKFNAFTDNGAYSTTAENAYRFLSGREDFNEAHTALNDSEIELEILRHCILDGAPIDGNFIARKTIERKTSKNFQVFFNKKEVFSTNYSKKFEKKDENGSKIFLSGMAEM